MTILGAVLAAASTARAAGPLPPLGLPPVNEAPPSIAGSATAGSTVTCSQGQWLNGPTSYVYSWQRDVVTTVSGPSDDNRYTLTSADVGALITCTVVAANSSGSGVEAISLPVIPGSGAGSGAGGGTGSTGGSSPGGATGTGGAQGSTNHGATTGAPTLGSFSASSRRLTIVRGHRRWWSRGLKFRFTIDRGAEVVIVIERQRPGARGARCRSSGQHRRSSCTRYVVARTLTATESASGSRTLWWAGRAAGHFLASGRYLAYASAFTSGGWSATRSTSFAVVRRRD